MDHNINVVQSSFGPTPFLVMMMLELLLLGVENFVPIDNKISVDKITKIENIMIIVIFISI